MFPVFVRFATAAATATLVLAGGARARAIEPDVLVTHTVNGFNCFHCMISKSFVHG